VSAPRVLQPRNALGLTAHQMAILRAYAQGCEVAEMAQRFGVTEGTVYVHINRIHRQLGFGKRAGARRALYIVGVFDAGREKTARRLCPAFAGEGER
jgi:DNA-binding NarL/FixJ family response regulator